MDRSTTVDAATLALLLNISAPSLRRLAADGVIPKTGRNQFKLFDAIPAFIEYTGSDDQTASAFKAARARKMEIEVQQAEMDLAVSQGKYVLKDGVLSRFTTAARQASSALLAVPGRLRTRLPHLTLTDVEIIDAEIRAVMTTLANSEPEQIAA
jgi:hypothetical protein